MPKSAKFALSLALTVMVWGATATAAEDESNLGDLALQALAASDQSMAADPQVDQTSYGVSYLYGIGQPELVCASLRVCEIALEPGETLLPAGVHMGDSTRWAVTPMLSANRRTILVVKPTDHGLTTNMTIHTDRRSYAVLLRSTEDQFIPRISWRYPQSAQSPHVDAALISGRVHENNSWVDYHADVAAFQAQDNVANTIAEPAVEQASVRLDELDHNYRVEPCRRCDRFAPRSVYNDGRSTYLVLPAGYNGDLPTFALLDGPGGVVNQRWNNGTLQVETVFNRGVLILGRKQVGVEWLRSD